MLDCGDRTCPRCQENRRRRIYSRFSKIIKRMNDPRFLTLTLERCFLSRKSVRRLRRAFTKLRHRKLWTATGGVYQIEVGTIDMFGFCNLHLHTIFDGSFIPKKVLEDAWYQITGNSWVIDIKRCFSARGALQYLTKHMLKRIGDPEHADLINLALHNARLVQGYGTLFLASLGLRAPVCPECGGICSTFGAYDFYYDGFLEHL